MRVRSIMPTILLLSSALASGCVIEPVGTTESGTSATKSDTGTPFGDELVLRDGDIGDIYGSRRNEPVGFSRAQEQGALGKGDLTVLMVVDRSGSMSGSWDGASKWEIARSSLSAAINGVEDQVTIGALFFPQGDTCDVAPLEDHRQFQFQSGELFQQRLGGLSDELGGGTPLSEAFLRADDAIMQATSDGALDGRFRVVLVTDGEPTCLGNSDDLVDMANNWRELGVEVHVMGLPGSEAAARLLDRIAGKETSDESPPPSSWDAEPDSGSGYIAPQNQADVDDSLHAIVR